LTHFLGGGKNMKETKWCVQKHKTITIFQNGGDGEYPPAPQMTSLY